MSKPLSIQYYMQFFPGQGAVGTMQPITLARTLADRGHHVRVLSADYNIDSNAPELPYSYESPHGGRVEVLRLRSKPGGRETLKQRLVSYVDFMFIARKAGLALPRPDVVIGSIQPMFTGRAALQVARIRKAPFVLEVRDLWPDALEVKGAVTGWKAKGLHLVVNQLYRHADRIISITPGIRTELLKKPQVQVPVDCCPNGFDPALFDDPRARRKEVREKYGWGDDFVAIYTGAHAKVTAVEVIVRTAERLRDRAGIRFAVFGHGPTKQEVVELSAALNLSNIEFHPPVPKHEIPGLLGAADAALMTLFHSPLIHIYFQNKFMDYMGASCPILAALEGEQADIIRSIDAGIVVPTFDAKGLAEAVIWGREHPTDLAAMGERGKRFVFDRLLLNDILHRYADAVEATAQGRASTHPVWTPFL